MYLYGLVIGNIVVLNCLFIDPNSFGLFHFRFGIYESEIRADNESSAVEDWFKAQGHSVNEPNIGIRQRLKNMYVELRYGLNYYNFPWRIRGKLCYAFFCQIHSSGNSCGEIISAKCWYL